MDFPVLNKCPGHNLYIGGFIALRRPKALQNSRITHIVSVLEWQFDADNPLTRGYQHLHIPVDDVEDENLLVWFPKSNAFIHEALTNWRPRNGASRNDRPSSEFDVLDAEEENGVLIHCAMGKSRSATVLIAYLLWQSRRQTQSPNTYTAPDSDTTDSMVPLPRKPLSVIDALTLLRQGRPVAEPNEGFMDQLHLYVDMGCPTTQSELENHKLYRRWMNKRNVEESLRINRAPDMVDIIFEDESLDDDDQVAAAVAGADDLTTGTKDLQIPKDAEAQEPVAPGISAPIGTTAPFPSPSSLSQPQTMIKCRRCRHTLATTPYILPHTPSHSDPTNNSQPCAHIFLSPLSWMKETLSQGQLEGRLSCPNKKCGQNVGKFAWQGLRCSCGKWVTPGFGVGKGKVDEVMGRSVDSEGMGRRGLKQEEAGGGGAVRLPPRMRGWGKM